jgi:hypothetical protein
VLVLVGAERSRAQSQISSKSSNTNRVELDAKSSSHNVLSANEWQRVDTSVARALNWLAAQQQHDGSFPTNEYGQPGVTALCILAFVAHGHMPGQSPHGVRIEGAADYVLRCQKQNGLISHLGPEGPQLSRRVPHAVGETACYNHAISSLMLSELYGMSEGPKSDRMQKAIAKAIAATLVMQRWPKDDADDAGGWRYLDDANYIDSDLSVTGWQLMFLRSARNAGFDVPAKPIDDAVAYVRRCYDRQYRVFSYSVNRGESRSRAMAGAGILALAHAGFHDSIEAEQSGRWVLENDFDNYNHFDGVNRSWQNDRYHYSIFMCCQAMYQLGGRHWEEFFPSAAKTLLANQQPDGSWPVERYNRDGQFGNAYTTALVVLSLGAANQFLPIFQR